MPRRNTASKHCASRHNNSAPSRAKNESATTTNVPRQVSGLAVEAGTAQTWSVTPLSRAEVSFGVLLRCATASISRSVGWAASTAAAQHPKAGAYVHAHAHTHRPCGPTRVIDGSTSLGASELLHLPDEVDSGSQHALSLDELRFANYCHVLADPCTGAGVRACPQCILSPSEECSDTTTTSWAQCVFGARPQEQQIPQEKWPLHRACALGELEQVRALLCERGNGAESGVTSGTKSCKGEGRNGDGHCWKGENDTSSSTGEGDGSCKRESDTSGAEEKRGREEGGCCKGEDEPEASSKGERGFPCSASCAPSGALPQPTASSATGGGGVDVLDQLRRPPLFYACRAAHEAVVRTLLKRGASVLADPHGAHALPLALCRAAAPARLLRVVLQAGAAADCTLQEPLDHPLCVLAARGDTDLVCLLIGYGAVANQVSSCGVTPLLLAVRGGHFQTASVLLEAGAQCVPALPPSLCRTFFYHHHAIYQAAAGDTCSSVGGNCSEQCTDTDAVVSGGESKGERSMLGLLLKHCRINEANGVTPSALEVAAVLNDTKAVRVLLRCGAVGGFDRSTGRWPLAAAALSSAHDEATLSLLLDSGADPNEMPGAEMWPSAGRDGGRRYREEGAMVCGGRSGDRVPLHMEVTSRACLEVLARDGLVVALTQAHGHAQRTRSSLRLLLARGARVTRSIVESVAMWSNVSRGVDRADWVLWFGLHDQRRVCAFLCLTEHMPRELIHLVIADERRASFVLQGFSPPPWVWITGFIGGGTRDATPPSAGGAWGRGGGGGGGGRGGRGDGRGGGRGGGG
eukprot:TRINITY_DN494_c1_g1_i1.p1 TRINITY_DN494_c1_g1~~TRINITY_DN494_c1_g1_i1.p1  ORF type:complete len:804 (+),score=99.08 TRINITY_DN494_c1_g1_i1:50-2461(+)